MGRVGRVETGNYFPIFDKKFLDIELYMNDTNYINNNLKIQKIPPIELDSSYDEIIKLVHLNLISNPSDLLTNKFLLMNTPTYEVLSFIFQKLQDDNILIKNGTIYKIDKVFLKYINLPLNYKSIMVIKTALENNEYRIHLKSIIVLLSYYELLLSPHAGIIDKDSKYRSHYHINKDTYYNYLTNFYGYTTIIFQYNNYNYLNTSDIGQSWYLMNMNIIKGFQEGAYRSAKNVIIHLKSIIQNIDLIENNYTNKYINQLYNYNVLGNQATYYGTEEGYNNIYSCMIQGYNNIYKKDDANNNIYISVNDTNKKIKYNMTSDWKTGFYKDMIYKNPEYIHVDNLIGNKANNDRVIFYSEKIYKKYNSQKKKSK